MHKRSEQLEVIGYSLVFLVAVLFRFINLGQLPLSDAEAVIALHAHDLITGKALLPNGDVLLTNLLAFLMYIFGNANIIVSLVNATIGTILVLMPILFRDRFNKKMLLIISFWLALDPGFISLSRQVNSTILVIFLVILALYFWFGKKAIPFAVITGVLILNGRSFWFGLIPIGFAYLVSYLRKSQSEVDIFASDQNFLSRNWRKILLSLLTTILLGSTFFFIFISQFGGIAEGFLAYFSNMPSFAARSIGMIFRTVIIYQFPLIIFGVTGLFTHFSPNKRVNQFFVFWLIFATLHILIYPSRSLEMLIWLEIPLIIATSKFLQAKLTILESEQKNIGLVSGIGLIVFGFLVLIASNLFSSTLNLSQSPITKSVLVIAGVILVAFAIFLIGWSLSWRIAGKSILIISVFYFTLYTVSASWNAAGLRSPYQNEMWSLSRVPKDADLLLSTIEDYDLWNHSDRYSSDLTVVNFDYPSMHWLLRNFTHVNFSNTFNSFLNPEMIISLPEEEIAMAESYRGQDFSFFESPNWSVLIANEWQQWILSRQIPANMVDQQQVILWVRNDLFPGANPQ